MLGGGLGTCRARGTHARRVSDLAHVVPTAPNPRRPARCQPAGPWLCLQPATGCADTSHSRHSWGLRHSWQVLALRVAAMPQGRRCLHLHPGCRCRVPGHHHCPPPPSCCHTRYHALHAAASGFACCCAGSRPATPRCPAARWLARPYASALLPPPASSAATATHAQPVQRPLRPAPECPTADTRASGLQPAAGTHPRGNRS